MFNPWSNPSVSVEPVPLNAPDGVARRFASQLAELRSLSGETQKQLAVRLAMTESMISRLESGAHIPSIATLCRIADGFQRRLDITFHEHEHRHDDGMKHKHVHGHDDVAHMHDHEDER